MGIVGGGRNYVRPKRQCELWSTRQSICMGDSCERERTNIMDPTWTIYITAASTVVAAAATVVVAMAAIGSAKAAKRYADLTN